MAKKCYNFLKAKQRSLSSVRHGKVVPKLYTKAKFLGYRRSLHTQHEQFALLKIEGVCDRKETPFYLGKRVCFIQLAKPKRNQSRVRTIWGRIATAHGNSGVVRARFSSNLPSNAIGRSLRVYMYPSNI
eukprot:TRINITY_DN367_c1_g1_i1.p1 TRINITY_DN367_c1_g1~~TRINITY_DN367_c1_g1_i1.p1  ORF type:complete len:129 (-),score=53.06 TRINITY_DN367_c1_g1_i1:200-586(-)